MARKMSRGIFNKKIFFFTFINAEDGTAVTWNGNKEDELEKL